MFAKEIDVSFVKIEEVIGAGMFAKELMLRTCGANGRHQWCWVLNALQ